MGRRGGPGNPNTPFAKRGVILMGGSWGSALAVNMAMAQPDLFHAYIGTAQLTTVRAEAVAGDR